MQYICVCLNSLKLALFYIFITILMKTVFFFFFPFSFSSFTPFLLFSVGQCFRTCFSPPAEQSGSSFWLRGVAGQGGSSAASVQ